MSLSNDVFNPSRPPSSLTSATLRSDERQRKTLLNPRPSEPDGQTPLELHSFAHRQGHPSPRHSTSRNSLESSSELTPLDQTLPGAGSEEEDGDSRGGQHMNRKNRARRAADQRSASADGESNGHTGDMSSPLEHRRKYNANVENSPASQAASLMSRESFTLDEDPKVAESSDHGFFDLPPQDRKNFLILVLLYFLQGIPLGLSGGSVPFLLKSAKYGVSYSQIGVFSLASYPYSLKLLWSPIVDAVWSPRIGRRKSWILPVQVLSGLGMLWLGANAETMMESAGANGGAGIWAFTWWWFFLVFTCATQDIAVDGRFAAYKMWNYMDWWS